VPSEKNAVGWGSDDNEMRMITASFFRAIERFAGDLCLHFLPRFQKVVAIRKTCNQLAVMLARSPTPFVWTDATYQTPELDDLIVYELEVEQFNDMFDGVIDRLTYLQSLGVNCLELMPVTSPKLDFD